jgi:hypothetical protein
MISTESFASGTYILSMVVDDVIVQSEKVVIE